jgi:hypothetical protein
MGRVVWSYDRKILVAVGMSWLATGDYCFIPFEKGSLRDTSRQYNEYGME